MKLLFSTVFHGSKFVFHGAHRAVRYVQYYL